MLVNEDTQEIVSAAEFARRLGVDRSAVRRYVLSGRLVPVTTDYQGLKPQPKFRATDVELFRRPLPPTTEGNEIV
jgi:hypothetical protein